MSKQKYWIADPNGGAKALVEGAAERDRWVQALGWSEAAEPGTADQVWMRHAATGGQTTMGAEAAAPGGLWEGLGWSYGPPPEPVDLTKDPTLVDQTPQPAPAAAAPQAAPAAQNTVKEK